MLRVCARSAKKCSTLRTTPEQAANFLLTFKIMSDTEMDGGVALDVTSPTHSHLADQINGGAMDVDSALVNAALSTAGSTATGRLYVQFGLSHAMGRVCLC